MATAPTVPDFTQYNWQIGDTIAMIDGWNGFSAAMVNYGQSLAAFGEQIEQEQQDTLDAANQIKTDTQSIYDEQVVPARDAAAQSAADAATARDEAQQIAAGDVAVTDLRTGITDQNDIGKPAIAGEQSVIWGPNWITLNADAQLETNNWYKLDTTAGTFTLTLPADPVEDNFVRLVAYKGDMNGVIIDPGASSIMDTSTGETMTINNSVPAIELAYNGSTWRVY